MSTSRDRQGAESVPRVAGNGLLDRRALLSQGAAFAGAMGAGAVTTGAAAEPLANDPWSLAPGSRSRLTGSRRVSRTRPCAP